MRATVPVVAFGVFAVMFLAGNVVRPQAPDLLPKRQPEKPKSSVELGRELFSDPRLSSNGKISCATCHIPDRGFASGGLPDALDGGKLPRRAPTLFNVGNRRALFLDGRAKTLEEQFRAVMTNPREMGNKTVKEAAERMGLTEQQLVAAVCDFERTITRTSTRFERFLAGANEPDLLTQEQARGWEVFRGVAHCARCHTGRDFTDDKFHNTGVGVRAGANDVSDLRDLGAFKISGDRRVIGGFKTPQLWGVKDAGPYMHDASLKTLEDVIEFYDRGGVRHRFLGSDVEPLRLTGQQKRDLLAFLRML